MPQSEVSRIESGRILPTVVLSLARVPRTSITPLWRSYARAGIWRKQPELKALAESLSAILLAATREHLAKFRVTV
jgi:hypothetical protein